MAVLAYLDYNLCISVANNGAMLKPQLERGYRKKFISCLNFLTSEISCFSVPEQKST